MGSEEWRQWQLEWLPSPQNTSSNGCRVPASDSTNKEQEFFGFTTQVPTAITISIVGGKRLLTALKLRWEGVHYSDAANDLIANQTMGGSLSNSPASIAEACRNPPQWWRGQWGLKKSVEAVAVGVVLVAALSTSFGLVPQKKSCSACQFPAMYNFGDSNSDTGSFSATFYRLPSPYGYTFFGKPSAQKLGFPFLSAYLNSIGANFHCGANFAIGASTIQPLDVRTFGGGYSPISLNVQLSQFAQFKARVNELFPRVSDERSYVNAGLPRAEDFSKALYTLDIGQNDLSAGLSWKTADQLLENVSSITAQLALTIEQLYQQGARVFWIHNTGPLGCLPSTLAYKMAEPGDLDKNGCLKRYNEVCQEFNRQLKERVLKLRAKLSEAVLTYVDIYAAKYTLISEAEKYGFTSPLAQCCGSYGDVPVRCGVKAIVNGTEVGGPCSNPSQHINWDGGHYSDAANEWLATRIMDGAFSDPPVSITEACHKTPQF
ncbi:GDSL esterase/lipase At5g14450-like [Pyrus x bretschneideri]|uniref:GDSL esterase/lipase At5g14450-like n=1 Tax=Pyrus x bretschneideri TaxID=225117 RepID=UPI00202FB08E|nr:GDSL esterase/lipase At5g14450-like [Pyrus x bretschneideri]